MSNIAQDSNNHLQQRLDKKHEQLVEKEKLLREYMVIYESHIAKREPEAAAKVEEYFIKPTVDSIKLLQTEIATLDQQIAAASPSVNIINESHVPPLVVEDNEALRRELEFYKGQMRYMAVFIDHNGCGSSKVSDKNRTIVRDGFGNKCWICGTTTDLSVAHIIPGNKETFDKTIFEDLNHDYDSKFELSDPRNMLLLCGDKNKKGTCHYHYDNHQWSIFYNGLDNHFYVVRFSDAGIFHSIDKLRDPLTKPYRRAMAIQFSVVCNYNQNTIPAGLGDTVAFITEMCNASKHGASAASTSSQ